MTATKNQRAASLALWMAELEINLAEMIESASPDEDTVEALVAHMARIRAQALTDMATDYCAADVEGLQ